MKYSTVIFLILFDFLQKSLKCRRLFNFTAAHLQAHFHQIVHKCDDCDKVFLGAGYKPNIVDNLFSSEDKIICKECAEKQHALSIAMGKSVDDFKRDLFE